MNLKEVLKNLTDEELGEILSEYANRQLEKVKKKEKEEPDHYYEFTGTWSWGVWAPSQEEAVERFKESCIEDFEILTDECKVEQYE